MRVILLAVGLLCVGCGKGGLSRGVPDDWTHKEVGEYFRKNGLPSRFVVWSHGTPMVNPSGYYVLDGSKYSRYGECEQAIVDGDKDVILTEVHKTPQNAKDQAATYKTRGHASGRWCFVAHPDTTAKIKAILP